MAKGKKTGGKDWTPGNGGPGRPRVPAEIKKASLATKADFLAMMGKFASLTDAELIEVWKNPALTQMEKCVLKIIENAVGEGDPRYISFLADQLYGKLPTPKEIEIKLPMTTYIERRNGDIIELGAAIEGEVVESDEP